MNAAEEQLLFLLQKGVPLVPRPFAELGATVGLTEEQVLQFVRDQFRDGVARRLGAVFDSRYLGYRSALCASRIEDAAARCAHVVVDLTGFQALGNLGEAASLVDGVLLLAAAGWTRDDELSRLNAELPEAARLGVVLLR